MRKTYDLIFSLGEACPCTAVLREAKLQFTTGPLDWLCGPGFADRIDLVVSDFHNFININELEYVETQWHDVYYHRGNRFFFNHDFPKNGKLSNTYPMVKEKYERRIKRLYDNINNAHKILAVYMEIIGT